MKLISQGTPGVAPRYRKERLCRSFGRTKLNTQQGSQTSNFSNALPNGTALLVIDMVNCFDFPGADILKPEAQKAALAISHLLSEARRGGYPIIYVNDNFDQWHSEKSKLIETAQAEADSPELDAIWPRDGDYFIIKPQFSGFYATNLPVLLPKLGISKLILTGVATDICVLFTAADAHMRDYRLWIPKDAVAAESKEKGEWALEVMRDSMKAEVSATTHLTIADWSGKSFNSN
ncbi:cysteine hydrolase [Novosphingobium sp. HR1a]|nr:cysteine hydrolase [Novosphingobium sp. HR1a]